MDTNKNCTYLQCTLNCLLLIRLTCRKVATLQVRIEFSLVVNVTTPCDSTFTKNPNYCILLYTLYTKDGQNRLAWFSGFSTFGQPTLDMGVFIRSMGNPDCKDILAVPDSPPLLGGFGGMDDL